MAVAAQPSDSWSVFLRQVARIAPYLGIWLSVLLGISHVFPEPAAIQLFVVISIGTVLMRNFSSRRSEPSAYPAFNRGGAALLGELRADQIDNEIRQRSVDWGEEMRENSGNETDSGDEWGGRRERESGEVFLDMDEWESDGSGDLEARRR